MCFTGVNWKIVSIYEPKQCHVTKRRHTLALTVLWVFSTLRADGLAAVAVLVRVSVPSECAASPPYAKGAAGSGEAGGARAGGPRVQRAKTFGHCGRHEETDSGGHREHQSAQAGTQRQEELLTCRLIHSTKPAETTGRPRPQTKKGPF